MTTGGEGGMLLTGSVALDLALKALGIGPLDEVVVTAIGRVQLRKLPAWLETRRRNAAILTERLGGLEALRTPRPPEHVGHACYKHYAFVRPERLRAGWSRDRIMNEIVNVGVPCFSGSCSEIYLERAFADPGLQPAEHLRVARELGETSLVFLVDPARSVEDVEAGAMVARGVIETATAPER